MQNKFIFIATFFLSLNVLSQNIESVVKNARAGLNEKEIHWLNTAHEKYNSNFYKEAILNIDSIKNEDQLYLTYLKGIFYAHDESTKYKALKYFHKVSNMSGQMNDYYFNKGFAYSRLDSFAQAIESYNLALDAELSKKHKNEHHVDEIEVRIDQCKNILAAKEKVNEVKIKNIGLPINTEFSEYGPVITSNEQMMVYTYRGAKSVGGKQKYRAGLFHQKKLELYYEDIFISAKINDTLWGEPEPIVNLDTRRHDAVVSINSDGTEMFIYENIGNGEGDLYLTRLKGTTWSKPIKQHHLNSPEWDGSACFIPNENRIIISSERPGGYGGKDLYYAEKIKDNVWGNIKNLGPTVNSKFDEDAPFVTADGKILFFSTNNGSSIGGYDIERSDLVNGFWSKPYNLGPPINTIYDDRYFTVRADGKVAYYSSGKKDGVGEQDIYMVAPGIPGKPTPMLQVEGQVLFDGKPAEAEIELRSLIKNPSLNYTFKANEVSGKFLCNLLAKDEYELTVRTNRFPPQVIILNTMNIDSFEVISVFAEFHTPEDGYNNNANSAKNYLAELTSKLMTDSVLTQRFGKTKVQNAQYRVQIGAYRFPENFNYNNLIGMPKIVMQRDEANVAHFTMGSFETYDSAIGLLNKVKSFIPDAFIVVYDHNKRIPLNDYWKNLGK